MNQDATSSRANYVKRWGNSISIVLLDSSCLLFSIAPIEGVIGYRIEANFAIVFGDPLCDFQDLFFLIEAFHVYCKKIGKKVLYANSSAQFMEWALKNGVRSAIQAGFEVIIDPCQDPKSKTGANPSRLRNKYNQAIRNNMIIKEYSEFDATLENDIKKVADTWLASRKSQIYFLPVTLLANHIDKRIFYAAYNGQIEGILIINRAAHDGWVLHVLMLAAQSQKYTSEVLILHVLDVLRSEGSRSLATGIPATQLGRIEGFGFFQTLLARIAFAGVKKLFQLEDRQRYWKKFEPRFEPLFILFESSGLGLGEIKAIMRAFNAHF